MTRPGYISEQEATLLNEYEEVGLIASRDCATMSASINAELWSAVSSNKKRVIVRLIAGWCAKQGYPYKMSLIDIKGRAVLARWDGRESSLNESIAR